MAYSYMTAVSDGTLKSMPITFNYMKEDDLVVHHNVTRLTKGIDYTINNNIITFAKVIPALDRVAVDRMSQRDALRVDFTEGATFSRDNIDDVLTQLLYLTQEAVEGSVDRISPTGVLDLAGNRIINLGDPIDLQDAVPLHLVVDAEKSVYASEAKCKQYRDEALGYKNAAFTSADKAYASEVNAKKSEANAKTSEINAANSAASVLGAVEQSAASAAAAKVSETNAKGSENAVGAMVDRVEDALTNVEGYGSRLSTVEGKVSVVEKYTYSDVDAAPSGFGLGDTGTSFTTKSGFISHNDMTNPAFPTHGAGFQSTYFENRRAQFFIGAAGTGVYSRFSLSSIVDDKDTPWERHYTTSYKPTPKDIGAFPSSSITGKVSEGALFETYTKNGWTVVKRADGTMTMWKRQDRSATSSSAGFVGMFEEDSVATYPESFATGVVPTMSYICWCDSKQHMAVFQRYPVNAYNKAAAVNLLVGSGVTSVFHLVVTVHGFWKLPPSTLDEPEFNEDFEAPQVLPYDPEI